MRTPFTIVLAFIALLAAERVSAWSAPGHMLIGEIADERLKGTKAAAQVKKILTGSGKAGTSLQNAAIWPDCAKAIEKTSSGSFIYPPHPQYLDHHCVTFYTSAAAKKEMIQYVSQNYGNCEYSYAYKNCDKAYHFSGIPYQQGGYSATAAGATNADVVHAILAAIAVLRGQPAPAPFQIGKDKKLALRMLAHFIGDMHQPLHIGNVYLDATGKVVVPAAGGITRAIDTIGGNALSVASSDQLGSPDLHGAWDQIDPALSTADSVKALVAQAAMVPAVIGKPEDAIAGWAGESVAQSATAYGKLSYGAQASNSWPVTFTQGAPAYIATKAQIQKTQIVNGGARLAQVLRAIWPD